MLYNKKLPSLQTKPNPLLKPPPWTPQVSLCPVTMKLFTQCISVPPIHSLLSIKKKKGGEGGEGEEGRGTY
jgi:hypothetical protein